MEIFHYKMSWFKLLECPFEMFIATIKNASVLDNRLLTSPELQTRKLSTRIRCQKKKFHSWSAEFWICHCHSCLSCAETIFMLLLVALDSAMPWYLRMSRRRSPECQSTWWPNPSIASNNTGPFLVDQMLRYQSTAGISMPLLMNSMLRPAKLLDQDSVPKRPR